MRNNLVPSGERQVATEIEGIRRDHVARYEWVNDQIKPFSKIIDACCGVGYGSNTMAKMGHTVSGIDISTDAIEFARKNWKHSRVKFHKADLAKDKIYKKSDVAVAFECIEHIQDPRPMLKGLRKSAPMLLASVPNENVIPWHKELIFHYRHYTKGQFKSLLEECGWYVVNWFGQEGAESEVEPNKEGRTLIASCIRAEPILPSIKVPTAAKPDAPEHVSICGLGPSLDEYTNITRRLGSRTRYCDETWAINALGNILQCDRIFHMDDVRIQQIRAEAKPQSNTAAMLEWMKTTEIPIITSRKHSDYPSLIEFPLLDVLNEFDTGYFNSTAAYAVAYACWLRVKKISLFGIDFTYPGAHDAEKGRACVEYWMGIASQHGIKLTVPKSSTLLDALHPQAERFYGYDTYDLKFTKGKDRAVDIEFTDRAELPTAEQIEAAYDHNKHPNALMSEVKNV